ncbi:hypothetical protein BDV96DRAFT_639883 [Lophiotrema nucula]|uniref:Uncharacterized protein n=1 Tax=Lophiotrema nucula TaxID=690887 RepID=A0A6A5ZTZ1_9PLEO|nr:hypothetical protein BDV96DRAFT_639883 [Lophiotrema nucula]
MTIQSEALPPLYTPRLILATHYFQCPLVQSFRKRAIFSQVSRNFNKPLANYLAPSSEQEMEDVVMGGGHSQDQPPKWKLDTLPAEIHRLIVSHLAPTGSDIQVYGRRAKIHLKNANFAHRCLREWVPAFMFRDMTLLHVQPNMASSLSYFGASHEAAELRKHVKSIQVKVPSAIRWEVDTHVPFDFIDDITASRLCKSFGLTEREDMNNEQQDYCANYHRALVEPFTDNRRWYKLLSSAIQTWPQIFNQFPNVNDLSVGICERDEHPWGTSTHQFVCQYGPTVLSHPDPKFVEDPTANLAWASSIILQAAPHTVKTLGLSAANLDSLNSFSTVNRLLSMVYSRNTFLDGPHLDGITSLTLDVRGVEGTHGSKDWHGDTGSIGMARYWTRVLKAMKNLKYLDIQDILYPDCSFTEGEESYTYACVLEWILPAIDFPKLETLRLRDSLVSRETLPKLLSRKMPSLKSVVLDEVHILLPETIEDEGGEAEESSLFKGQTWLEACQWLTSHFPGVEVHLVRPLMTLYKRTDSPQNVPRRLHSDWIRCIAKVKGVTLVSTGEYRNVVGPARNPPR